MTEASPVQGRPGHAALSVLAMAFLLDKHLYLDVWLLYHRNVTHSDSTSLFAHFLFSRSTPPQSRLD